MKKCVLRFFLKTFKEVSILKEAGSSFQTLGAEKEKLLSPSVLNFVTFGFNRFKELERKALGGL